MGDSGPVYIGDIHKEKEAEEIFEEAISGGSGAAITSETTEKVTTETVTEEAVIEEETRNIFRYYKPSLENKQQLVYYKFRKNLKTRFCIVRHGRRYFDQQKHQHKRENNTRYFDPSTRIN